MNAVADIGVIQVHNMTTTELLTFLLTTKSVKRGQSQFGFGKVDLKLTQRTDGEFLEVHIYDDQNKDMICVSAKVEDVEYYKHQKDSEQ
jgi:hypothetical protein